MLKLIYFILLLAVTLVGASFASINSGDVSIDYYFGVVELPLGIIVFTILGLGILVGLLALMPTVIRLRHENSTLRHQAQLTNQEVRNLRTIPVRDR